MVVVVEDEYELLLGAVKHFVQEHVDGAFGSLREFFRRLLHVGDRGVAEAVDDLSYAVRDVAEEDERVCVRPVELIPDEGALARAYEVGDESCFAGACGSRDERDGVREVLLHALCESRSRQERRRGARRQKFRAQEECRQLRSRRGGRLRVVRPGVLGVRHVRHRLLLPRRGKACGGRVVFGATVYEIRRVWRRV